MSINFDDFAGGALQERLNVELQKVLTNIADPNTDPKKPRILTVKLTLTADEKRDLANVSIITESKLVPAKEVETRIILDRDNDGQVIGQELKSNSKGQMFIDESGDIADDRGNKVVVPFK